MPQEDLDLTQRQVVAAQSGDRQALDDLFARYLPRVRRIVASRMGQTLREMVACEDVVQETFADALRGIARFDHRSEGAFCNWLARCVENNLRDEVRRAQAHKRGAGRVRAFGSLHGDTPSGTLSLSQSIFADEREPPSLAARTHEAESAEVARAMNLPSENTANVLFLRARDRLRALL